MTSAKCSPVTNAPTGLSGRGVAREAGVRGTSVMLIAPWDVIVPASPGVIGPGDGGNWFAKGCPGGKTARYLTACCFDGGEYGGGSSMGKVASSARIRALSAWLCCWSSGTRGEDRDEEAIVGVGSRIMGTDRGAGTCARREEEDSSVSALCSKFRDFFSSFPTHHSSAAGLSSFALRGCALNGLPRSVKGVLT